MERGIDFIERNLDVDVRSADVARHAGMSSWHFQRMFKALTNETLKAYIRSRRLTRSLTMLEATNERVIDIALAAGFESQESFTRAFRQAFDITPAHCRRTPGSVPLPRKVSFDREYLCHLQDKVTLEPEIVDLPAMHLLGMRTFFYGPESEKNNMGSKLPKLWADFLPRVDRVQHRAREGEAYGVLQQTNATSGKLSYWAAVQIIPDRGARTPGLESLELPAARYAKFVHRGNIRELDRTVNYIYSSWLLRSAVRHTYGPDLEHYDARYVPDSDESIMSYLIPVKPSGH